MSTSNGLFARPLATSALKLRRGEKPMISSAIFSGEEVPARLSMSAAIDFTTMALPAGTAPCPPMSAAEIRIVPARAGSWAEGQRVTQPPMLCPPITSLRVSICSLAALAGSRT